MGVILTIIGIILTLVTVINLIRVMLLNRKSIIKKAKVIGFESYTYLMPGAEYNTIYNASFYPILEIQEGDRKVRVTLSYISDKINLERGDEIEVVYPRDKVEKLRVYESENVYNFYYLTIFIGILITLLSITII